VFNYNNPGINYNNYVDIIAIDNLPSLLPHESSQYFSSKLVELLKTYKKDEFNHWKNNLNIYYKTQKMQYK
jgi:NAD/NADP transhydrogenase alpha subunit